MRRGFMIRFLFLTAACGVIIVGLHFYMYIYKGSASRSNQSPVSQQINKQPSEHYPIVVAAINGLEIPSHTHMKNDPRPGLKHKIVHLDLKGMPPKVEAYEKLFPFFKQIGVTGLLVEYEDMFPYEGKLQSISNKKSYSKEDIKKILNLAANSELEVVPLVQTFGHLEFVLKLEEFEQLREVPRYMQVVCPTRNGTQVLIRDMIDQIISLHPNIKYLHIGSDEVYHIGQCPLCQDRMRQFGIDESQLFLQHVKSVAQYVASKYVNVKPLMWDDEFRKLDEAVILKSGLSDLVEIIVWNYHTDVETILSSALEKYSRIFKTVWVGSAFKGADKPNSLTVNETLYLANHYSWVSTMDGFGRSLSFKGIFLTGWQRYDHFSVPCELLPTAIPSLASCMKYLNSRSHPSMDSIFANVSTSLNCGNYMNFCEFPGSAIHQEINHLDLCQIALKKIEEKNVYLGWAQEINLRLEYSNPSHVETILSEISSLKVELDGSQQTLQKSLQEFYPQWSVDEWMMTNFQPIYDRVKSLKDRLGKILDKRTFPRRPLELNPVTVA